MDLYSLPTQPPNWDAIGIAYVTICAIWSSLVSAGMIFLWSNKRMPMLRVRNLPLSFAAIFMLHLYWVLAQIVYPIGLTLPIVLAYDIQYFFMGIWFPLGIALFHASNTRFLHVAKQQKQLAHTNHPTRPQFVGSRPCLICRFKNLEYPTKILLYIVAGMAIQVLLTVGMWLACRKYHPSFGVPGTELTGTLPEQVLQIGRGWEWWPTAFWQVIWTWVVAPILIWKSWSIRDTLGWRTQTLGCCISNLHATPLWLMAMYLPVFTKVNRYFAPSEWLNLAIMMLEVFTILVPSVQVIRALKLGKKVADSNTEWETSSQTGTLHGTISLYEWKSASHQESSHRESPRIDSLQDQWGDRLLTMGALDYVLEHHPDPLQEFAALRDFSGENTAFLTRVSAWRASWPALANSINIRDTFTQALVIYTDFVSPRDAEFPINLSSHDLRKLENIFEKPARILLGEARVNPAVPFDTDECGRSRKNSQWACGHVNKTDGLQEPGSLELGTLAERAQYTGDIPGGFSLGVFDSAQLQIKLLVLTSTWPKFVAETQRRRSVESEWSGRTKRSAVSFASRLSKLVHPSA